MKSRLQVGVYLLMTLLLGEGAKAGEQERLVELDTFWSAVSRSVGDGDFEGYRATCHEKGVLVSGVRGTCQPLAVALARWKQEFADTREGKMKASVAFRFSQRLGDESTAHETGIFLYSTISPDGQTNSEYIHFECLLVKEGGWKTMMEYQKSKATEADWEALE